MYRMSCFDNKVQVAGDVAQYPWTTDPQKQASKSWRSSPSANTQYKAYSSGNGVFLTDLRPEMSRNWRETTVYNSTNWRETAAPLTNKNAHYVEKDIKESDNSYIPIEIRSGWAPKTSIQIEPGAMPCIEQGQGESNEIQIGSNFNGASVKVFTPSHAVLGYPPILTLDIAQKAAMSGMVLNPNYRGAVTEFHIENASTTAVENCSVRVIGIHPNATTREILQVIRTGKVYSVNRCAPEPGKILTAAADIVFVKRAAAEAFFQEGINGISIRGYRLTVTWNRNRVKEPKNLASGDSRIVQVEGPTNKLSVEILEDLFSQYFKFELVDARSWSPWNGRTVVEMTFESINPQAAWARRVVKQHFGESWGRDIHFTFGLDPCEQNAELTPLYPLTLPWRKGMGVSNCESSFTSKSTSMSWRANAEISPGRQLIDQPWREM